MMDFSAVRAITIPEGAASQLRIGGSLVWKKSPLPVGFTALRYIETDGKQYIDTGFTPDSNTRMVLDFEMTRSGVVSQIIGSRNTTSSRAFAFGQNDANEWRFGYGNAYYGAGESDTGRHVLDFDHNTVMLDGTAVGAAAEQEFTGAHMMLIGAVRATGKVYYGYARFYACQIYDNGTLVRDLLPCVNEAGAAGMYDQVSGAFYANAGSGTLIMGE